MEVKIIQVSARHTMSATATESKASAAVIRRAALVKNK